MVRRVSSRAWQRRKIADYYRAKDFEQQAAQVDREAAMQTDNFNAEWAQMKNEFAERERAQDQAAFEAKLDRESALNQQQPELPLPAAAADPVPSQLKDLQLIFAGNAYFTIRNNDTGNRFTFRVSKSKPSPQYASTIHFVSVLTGPDNTSSYSYLGIIKPNGEYKHGTNKSHVSENAQSVQVFKWLLHVIRKSLRLPPQVQIWHEGRCCRCGRMLTVPESIELGLGPECAGRI